VKKKTADKKIIHKPANGAPKPNAANAVRREQRPVTKKAPAKPAEKKVKKPRGKLSKSMLGLGAKKQNAAQTNVNAAPSEAALQPKSAAPKRPIPAKPVSGEQRKAYNKAVKNRTANKKKRGSRGGNYILYYVFAAIVVVVVFIILANTVLFNCSSIVVEGTERYTSEEIIEKSGLKLGSSLLSLDEVSAEQRIAEAFAYVDKVDVSKSFPTKIVITVTEAERWFAAKHGSRYYIVSRMGKIIDEGEAGNLPVIMGFAAEQPAVGAQLVSAVEGKNELPAQILAAAESAGLEGITVVDVTDRFELIVTVDDRITLELGLATELENKLQIAKELIATEITATESVTINLTNTEKVYVRDNNIIDNPEATLPVIPEQDTTEAPSETKEADTAEA